MITTLVVALITNAAFASLGYLKGYRTGYGEGKRAGYFRAHAEQVRQ